MTDGAGEVAGRILRAAIDSRGRRPLPWSVAPLTAAGRVLELGPGLLADELGPERWVARGDGAADGPAPLPLPLPLATNSVDAVCMLLVLPRLAALDAVFAEVRRVLRPAGTLVVVVPSVTVRTVPELALARLLRPVRRGAWPNRSGLDGAGWLLAAADFAVMGDDRVSFAVPLPDPAAAIGAVADLPVAGLWPDLTADVRTRIADELARRAGPGRVLPVPMRRLVARR
ncbi:MAG: methyltransferase domain-containing protein [Pseudonocardia sp.]